MAKKKATGVIIGIAAVVVVIGGLAYYAVVQNNKSVTYLEGMEAYENQDYETARDAFESVGNYENAKEILVEIDYQDALLAIQQGEDQKAEKLLLPIQDYKDTKTQLYGITYRKIKASMAEGDYDQAEVYAKEISGYEDVAQLMQEIIYHQAINKVDEMDFDGAKELLNTMTDAALAQKGMDRISYSKYCVPCVQDLYTRYTEGIRISAITGGRYCQVTYNSGNAFPVIMIRYNVVTENGDVVEQYAAYNNYDYFGTCHTIDINQLDMSNQSEMAAYLKIEPNWNSQEAVELSGPAMQALAGH